MVRFLLEGLAEVAGDLTALLAEYSDTLQAAQSDLFSRVGDARRATVDDAIAQAAAEAAERFSAVRLRGHPDRAGALGPRPSARASVHVIKARYAIYLTI